MGNKLHFANFIERLQCLRKEKGWTQQKLAEEMQVDLKTVRNWENKKTDPPACSGMKLVHFINLCKKLGCDPEYLLGDIPTKHKVNADIVAETGLSDQAVYTLRNLTDNEKLFLNKLLEDRESLYFIASGYTDLNRSKTLDRAISSGLVEDDFGPDTLEVKNKLNYARFTLYNRFMRFVD